MKDGLKKLKKRSWNSQKRSCKRLGTLDGRKSSYCIWTMVWNVWKITFTFQKRKNNCKLTFKFLTFKNCSIVGCCRLGGDACEKSWPKQRHNHKSNWLVTMVSSRLYRRLSHCLGSILRASHRYWYLAKQKEHLQWIQRVFAEILILF